MKNVLSLPAPEARLFFLKSRSYFSLDLPEYFNFDNLLANISEKIGDKDISSFQLKDRYPQSYEDVNYHIMSNKNGEYAWRPFQIIHPVIYVALVHKITGDTEWSLIQKRFKEFKKSCVDSVAIPVVSQTRNSDKAEQIFQWLNKIESQSIALALDYAYLFETDITDCYSSIYTHSIPWALHGREKMKERKNRSNTRFLGNWIDAKLQSMNYGQTNGIPQGSVLMDFFAEVLLGYADEILTLKLLDLNIKKKDYKILRYRDDYRIFANDPELGKTIVKCLTEVLGGLGLKLDSHKTHASNEIVIASIKQDKLAYISKYIKKSNLQSELTNIYLFSQKYQNSGTVKKLLSKFSLRIKSKTKISNKEVFISILTIIALNSPKTYPEVVAIMSKVLRSMNSTQKKKIVEKIKKKFSKIPNTGILDIWLQRMTFKIDPKLGYKESLCAIVSNPKSPMPWNSEWLNANMKKVIEKANIIDRVKISEMDEIINDSEILLFGASDGSY